MIDVLKFILFDENVIDQDWLWKKKKTKMKRDVLSLYCFYNENTLDQDSFGI